MEPKTVAEDEQDMEELSFVPSAVNEPRKPKELLFT